MCHIKHTPSSGLLPKIGACGVGFLPYTTNMQPLVITARQVDWLEAQKTGKYEQSTIDSSLEEVGFIHATFTDQTLAMVNRKYADQDDLILLLVDPAKVTVPIKHEGSLKRPQRHLSAYLRSA